MLMNLEWLLVNSVCVLLVVVCVLGGCLCGFWIFRNVVIISIGCRYFCVCVVISMCVSLMFIGRCVICCLIGVS